jgi:PAS domain S-box-containing protein
MQTTPPAGGLAFSDAKLDPAQQSLTLCDVRRPDMPLIYVNRGFEQMTGYTPAETIGRNCRFLQGPETDPAAVARIRTAVRAGEPLIIDLLNYRKDRSTFWNRLSLRPVRNASGELTHIVGIQSDISHMRSLEDRIYGFALELAGGARDRSA